MIMRQNHFLICWTLAPRQGLTRGTVVDVVCRIISKVAAREGAILSFVVHRNMWGAAPQAVSAASRSGFRPKRCEPRSGSGAPECDCARDGSGPGPHGAPVIATPNDPLTVFVADNSPHVMAPHHDDTDRRTARV